MMKKLIFVTSAFVACMSGAFAAETPSVVRASLVLLKNGVPVSDVALSMLEGRSSLYSAISTRSLLSTCKPDGSGASESKSSRLETGLKAEVTPLHVNADGALLSVGFSYSELRAIQNVQSKGCDIEVPITRDFESKLTVHVKPGQPVELPSTHGSDKYVLVVRRL